jgi:hypothetical protein
MLRYKNQLLLLHKISTESVTGSAIWSCYFQQPHAISSGSSYFYQLANSRQRAGIGHSWLGLSHVLESWKRRKRWS